MNEREIIHNILKDEMPDFEQVRRNCISQEAAPMNGAKPRSFRAAVLIPVAAAVLICAMLIAPLLSAENSFSIQAYAVEKQEDGSVKLQEFGITNTDSYEVHDGYVISTAMRIYDGEYIYYIYYIYKEILVKCDGNNIRNVEFFVNNDGVIAVSMAKSIIESWESEVVYSETGEEIGWGESGQIDDPEKMGSRYMLDWKDMNGDLMLLVGKPYPDETTSFNNMTVRVVATFNDGTTQEESISLGL